MKKLLAAALLVVLPIAVVAQSAAKAGSKTAGVSKSRVEARTLANQMAAGVRAAEAALTPAELAIAQQVYQGELPCELGVSVALTADAKAPGYFDVQSGNRRYRMVPVEARTGAIRLEDRHAGAVWLQLSNKSMLMDQKLGQRLADECMSPSQAVVAQSRLKNPTPGLLDDSPAAGPK